jgi:heat shock protein HslJ
VLIVICVTAACGTSERPSASGTALPAFDMAGTAWRAATISGRAPSDEQAPRLEIDWLGRPDGRGFTGCDAFGFDATFEPGRLTVGPLILNPSGCTGPGADVETAFLEAFRAADAWSVDSDILTLTGPRGQVVLTRDLPPLGDPGRQLAEILRVGEWRIVAAPGVPSLDALPAVRFADRMMIAAGECGFSSDVRFGSGGTLDIVEVGWETAGCGGPTDGRPLLKQVLEAVSLGRPGPEGTVVLSGARGDVLLGR